MATTEYFSSSPNAITNDDSPPEGATDPAVIYLSAVKITIGCFGIIGNVMVLVIMKVQRQPGKFLICSQAFIDMLTSIVFLADAFTSLYPPPVPKDFGLGLFYCLVWHYYATVFVLFALSTYNLVAISIERYILVLYPLYYRSNITRKKEVLLGLICWLIAPAMQLTYVLSQIWYDESQAVCTIDFLKLVNLLGVAIFIWDFFIPCIIMGFCFTRICVRLYYQDKKAKELKGHSSVTEISTISSKLSSSVDSDKKYEVDEGEEENVKDNTSDEYKRSRNVTKTFVIIFVVYIFCWVTNQFLFLQLNLGGYNHWGTPENHFANSLAMLNSACNPFIYVLHMKMYRDKIKAMFCC